MKLDPSQTVDPPRNKDSGADHWRAVAFLLLANAFWGVSFPVMKGLLKAQQAAAPSASEWFFASATMMLRFALAAVVLFAVCAKNLRALTSTEVRFGIGLGIFAGAGNLLQMVGIKYTLASTSAFLTQFYALLIPLTLVIVRRRLPSWRVWVSCALVIVGMGTLCGVDWRTFRLGYGEWLTLASSTLFMGQILWIDRKRFHDCNRARASLVMFVTIALIFLPVTLATGRASEIVVANASPAAVVMLAILGIVCSVGAYYLMNAWQPKVSATQAGLIYCFEPIFASLYAFFLPAWLAAFGGFAYANESLTFNLLVGGALITAANVLIQFEPPSQSRIEHR